MEQNVQASPRLSYYHLTTPGQRADISCQSLGSYDIILLAVEYNSTVNKLFILPPMHVRLISFAALVAYSEDSDRLERIVFHHNIYTTGYRQE